MPGLGPSATADEILDHLRAIGSEENRAGMARFGIKADRAFGVSQADLRRLSKVLKKNYERSIQLWKSGWREARVIAALTAEPDKLTREQARSWANDLDSWDIVDTVGDVFVDTPFWLDLIEEFAADDREFVRRAAFAMMAWANVPRKKVPEEVLATFFPLIERHATDPRNFVKKAVNWALRQTGKNSSRLHAPALALAEKLAASDDKTARWIGKDAVRELSAEKTIAMVAKRDEMAARRMARARR
ncbi:MAG: DNA alkylation repair protein [Rhizobiaceae bacterium]